VSGKITASTKENRMKKSFLLTVVVLALSVAAMAGPKVKTHGFTLLWNSEVGGKELKEGDYEVAVDGDTAKISRNGKVVWTVAVRSEEVATKYENNSVGYGPDGRHIAEIRLAGTNTKLHVEGPAPAAPGMASGK
jgi:hypothetical protein